MNKNEAVQSNVTAICTRKYGRKIAPLVAGNAEQYYNPGDVSVGGGGPGDGGMDLIHKIDKRLGIVEAKIPFLATKADVSKSTITVISVMTGIVGLIVVLSSLYIASIIPGQ